MHQLTENAFKIFHPRFFEEVFIKEMIDNYEQDARRLGGRFYALPNLFWGNSESKYVYDYDLLKRNLAYRLAGTDTFPESYEAFTDLDFERVDESFDMMDGASKQDYLSRFLEDVYLAHQLYRLTHVIVEPSFTKEDASPIIIAGARGGGFSCTC